MIKKYLLSRSNILKNIIDSNEKQIEINQLKIIELNNEIKELSEKKDEATELFSVNKNTRTYNNKEIERINKQIAAVVLDNKECEKVISITTKEFNIIKDCLDEYNNDVSRETFNGSTSINSNYKDSNGFLDIKVSDYLDNSRISDEFTEIKNNYIDVSRETFFERLKFCARIAETDGYRTKLELINIINDINRLSKLASENTEEIAEEYETEYDSEYDSEYDELNEEI